MDVRNNMKNVNKDRTFMIKSIMNEIIKKGNKKKKLSP